MVRYIIKLKRSITYVFSHYYAKIKINSYGSLPIEKRLTLHHLVILVKSDLNKDKNRYYHKIFLEKFSYQLAKKNRKHFIHRMIMLRFGKTKVTKENFYAAKNL